MITVTKDSGKEQQQYFKPGINENVQLQSIERTNTKPDGSGVEYTAFNFTNDKGATFKMNLWDIKEEEIRQRAENTPRNHTKTINGFVKDTPITPDDAVKIEEIEYTSKLGQILRQFLTEDEIGAANIAADTFNGVVNQVNNALKGKLNVPLRLKIVYNNKGYFETPKYGSFIEKMSINPSLLYIGAKDKITKDTADANAAHPADTSELPF